MRRILFFMFLLFFAMGFVSAQAVTYTGCLDPGGSLKKIAIGNLPNTPCRGIEQQISWNEIGPQGPQGEPGPQGEQGPIGECNCPITQAELDVINARLAALEAAVGVEARFTDMGDGTIRDNDSGLIWLKNANCFGSNSWPDAMGEALNLAAGQCDLTDGSVAGDWRLPTTAEWDAFVTTGYFDPALANTIGDGQWQEGDAFTGVKSDYYWSSTEENPYWVWCAGMFDGHIYDLSKSSYNYVWPVRDGN